MLKAQSLGWLIGGQVLVLGLLGCSQSSEPARTSSVSGLPQVTVVGTAQFSEVNVGDCLANSQVVEDTVNIADCVPGAFEVVGVAILDAGAIPEESQPDSPRAEGPACDPFFSEVSPDRAPWMVLAPESPGSIASIPVLCAAPVISER